MVDIDNVTLISLVTIITGVVGILIKTCLKSKCDTIECLCLKVHRNVELEEKVDEIELNRNNNL